MQQVWTFIITGPAMFNLQLLNNPRLIHPGGLTLWKMIGTKEDSNKVQECLKQYDVSITVYTEIQNEEQTTIRNNRIRGY